MGTVQTSENQSVNHQTYSLEEFMIMDFEEKVELVDGKIIFMGWNNTIHARLLMWLGIRFENWIEKNHWGLLFGGDAGIETKSQPPTARGADLICISFATYSRVQKKGKIIDTGPELIVEIVSPSNSWDDIHTKVREYFTMGTCEVWVVSPKHCSITAYTAPNEPRVYSLDGEKVAKTKQLPGLEISLEDLREHIALLGPFEED
jgi:Uma2 family endonuclease